MFWSYYVPSLGPLNLDSQANRRILKIATAFNSPEIYLPGIQNMNFHDGKRFYVFMYIDTKIKFSNDKHNTLSVCLA